MAIALKALLQQRHLHAYPAFVAEYQRRAKELDLPRRPAPPTKAQYYRWVGGQIHHLPRGDHCQVLEKMFPGWTARQLFAPCPDNDQAPPAGAGLLASVAPSVAPAILEGLWVTGFIFDANQRHIDLSAITVTDNGLTARNYPPEPRAENHSSGFRNDIEAGVFGRHVIGHWRNINDSYFYGCIHLAVLPGETVLDGYCTAFVSDTQVVAEPWRWVRVDPRSTQGVDLATVKLADPRRLYDAIAAHTRFDGAIPLDQLTED
ncbi:hypothetical protein MFM001_42630 [Mycobacterium sp. MFM001]|uniref:hypothetical protein n=1 Tax=Mycobacterium sp. MFM001 TaxID=2049453 RepID=UPI000DA5900D|nr:hypothetical protein [Mycobacterium sp. MFM001]GBE67801.1 hypothetical protein MFM001_42630 [Mycobacterium sp. MFM001]